MAKIVVLVRVVMSGEAGIISILIGRHKRLGDYAQALEQNTVRQPRRRLVNVDQDWFPHKNQHCLGCCDAHSASATGQTRRFRDIGG